MNDGRRKGETTDVARIAMRRFLGKDQRVHSMIWNDVVRVCEDCGQDFKVRVAVYDGKELPSMPVCEPCDQTRRRVEERNRRKEEANRFCVERREEWVNSLPAGFRNKTFGNFDSSLQPDAFDRLSRYKLEERRSLILSSPDIYGIGKTHLVCALAHRLFDSTEPIEVNTADFFFSSQPQPAMVVGESRMLSRIRQTFGKSGSGGEKPETEERVFRELELVPLLIIDDVGKVTPRDLRFLQSVYFEIIDSRYNEWKPTILTTNLNFKELEGHIGGACADRLREMCGRDGFIKMKGTSYRRRT